jgi:putative OPT family oligopeptide transporter
MSVLHKGYGIGTGEPGSLRAPQAALFASLTKGFFGGEGLPWDMIAIGAAIGVGLIVLNRILELSGSSFRAHVMPVAVGIYLPLSLDIPIFLGGLIRYLFGRRTSREGLSGAHDPGILYGSGLIAGEAIMGIVLAIPISLGYAFREGGGHGATSLLVFGGVLVLYAFLTSRSRRLMKV